MEETLQPVVHDPDDVSRISMATHELLENAVQYGTGQTILGLNLSPAEPPGSMKISLRLTNEASAIHIERLRAGVAALHERGAIEHYRYLMMKEWDVNQESSGMGLARIAVESELQLSIEVNGPRVTLSASGRVGGAPR